MMLESKVAPYTNERKTMDDFETQFDVEFLKNIISYNHEKYLSFKNGITFELNNDFEKVLKARYMKVSRIKRRLIYLLSHCDYIWFCTFTFSDKYINKSDRTKRDLIKNVLNTHDFKYMLNIDYGKKTEREHYHCIIGTDFNFNVNQFIQSEYPCFCLAIQCKKGREDFERLGKYINKLTNHCIKATTKRQRMLYNFKGFDDFCSNSKELNWYIFYWKKLLFQKLDDKVVDVTLLDKGNVT